MPVNGGLGGSAYTPARATSRESASGSYSSVPAPPGQPKTSERGASVKNQLHASFGNGTDASRGRGVVRQKQFVHKEARPVKTLIPSFPLNLLPAGSTAITPWR